MQGDLLGVVVWIDVICNGNILKKKKINLYFEAET